MSRNILIFRWPLKVFSLHIIGSREGNRIGGMLKVKIMFPLENFLSLVKFLKELKDLVRAFIKWLFVWEIF